MIWFHLFVVALVAMQLPGVGMGSELGAERAELLAAQQRAAVMEETGVQSSPALAPHDGPPSPRAEQVEVPAQSITSPRENKRSAPADHVQNMRSGVGGGGGSELQGSSPESLSSPKRLRGADGEAVELPRTPAANVQDGNSAAEAVSPDAIADRAATSALDFLGIPTEEEEMTPAGESMAAATEEESADESEERESRIAQRRREYNAGMRTRLQALDGPDSGFNPATTFNRKYTSPTGAAGDNVKLTRFAKNFQNSWHPAFNDPTAHFEGWGLEPTEKEQAKWAAVHEMVHAARELPGRDRIHWTGKILPPLLTIYIPLPFPNSLSRLTPPTPSPPHSTPPQPASTRLG